MSNIAVITRETPAQDLPELLSTKEACQALGISQAAFYKLKAQGLIVEANHNELLSRPRRAEYSRQDIARLRGAKRVTPPRVVFEFPGEAQIA